MGAQHRHFANDFLHPQRRKPVILPGEFRQLFHHQCQGRDGIIRVCVKNRADRAAKWQETLLDHRVEQLLTRIEIVMQHGWRHARFFRNGVERRIGDALAGKQLKGNIQQTFPAGGCGLCSTRASGATALRRGFRMVLLCWHSTRIP
ncbi:hypothetical protein D3C80_1427100 [compost metagenome]